MSQKSQIADAIIKLASAGPVTLAQVHDHVAGFGAPNGARKCWTWETDGSVIWDGMSRAGSAALRHVVLTRKVAVQQSNALTYFLHGWYLDDPTWTPIALVPAGSANFRTAKLLVAIPDAEIIRFMACIAPQDLPKIWPIDCRSGSK